MSIAIRYHSFVSQVSRSQRERVAGLVRTLVPVLLVALLLAFGGVARASDVGTTDPDGNPIPRPRPPMTAVATDYVVGRFIAALEEGDHARFFASDVELSRTTCGEPAAGRAAVAAAISGVCHGAFTGEWNASVTSVEAGTAEIHGIILAQQVEPFLGASPTGRTLVIPFSASLALEGNQIAALDLTVPIATIVHQLGTPDIAPTAPERGAGAF